MTEHTNIIIRCLLQEGDTSLRDLERAAKGNDTPEAWEAYERELRRAGRPLDAYKSMADRTWPKKGYYNVYESVDGSFSIHGPFKTRDNALRSVSLMSRRNRVIRRENRLLSLKQGPWVDHDAPYQISGPIYAKLFSILRDWAHRTGGREGNPRNFQLYIRDINGDIRDES